MNTTTTNHRPTFHQNGTQDPFPARDIFGTATPRGGVCFTDTTARHWQIMEYNAETGIALIRCTETGEEDTRKLAVLFL
jgi:hypothetical protein